MVVGRNRGSPMTQTMGGAGSSLWWWHYGEGELERVVGNVRGMPRGALGGRILRWLTRRRMEAVLPVSAKTDEDSGGTVLRWWKLTIGWGECLGCHGTPCDMDQE